MSLTDSPEYLFRPEDKALRMLFPPMEEPIHNSFDEFFDKELYNFSNDESGRGSPLFDDFFTTEYNHSPGPIKASHVSHEASPQPWRLGLWSLNSKSNPELTVEKTRKSGRPVQKFVSPTHLFENNGRTNKSPSSPSKTSTKAIKSNLRTANVGRGDSFPHAITREQTLSPTPMYVHLPLHGRIGPNEKWQQDFQNIHLQMPDDGTHLPLQHVDRPTEQVVAPRQANARNIARNPTIATPRRSPTKYHYPFNHVSRPNGELATNASTHELSDELSKRKLDQLHAATYLNASIDRNGVPFWTTESLHSSDSSHQSHSSHYSSDHSHIACRSLRNQTWMSPPLVTSAVFQPHESQPELMAPVPQRAAHQLLHHQQERYQGGLGIHYAGADEIGRAVSHGPNDSFNTAYRPVTPPDTTTESVTAYPPLPMYPEIFSNESPFVTPRRPVLPFSRSPSPSVSPTHGSPSRKVTQPSPTRRKSIHKPGPIKDSSQQDTARSRRRSGSRPLPRTPKTPKTPAGQIDFVNFTPKDSAKLMSDVAPSGSSKTRARREQEARDKRKRLSEAALQAIRNAGGDITALEDAIFV